MGSIGGPAPRRTSRLTVSHNATLTSTSTVSHQLRIQLEESTLSTCVSPYRCQATTPRKRYRGKKYTCKNRRIVGFVAFCAIGHWSKNTRSTNTDRSVNFLYGNLETRLITSYVLGVLSGRYLCK
jgi:hypothetical protein